MDHGRAHPESESQSIRICQVQQDASTVATFTTLGVRGHPSITVSPTEIHRGLSDFLDLKRTLLEENLLAKTVLSLMTRRPPHLPIEQGEPHIVRPVISQHGHARAHEARPACKEVIREWSQNRLGRCTLLRHPSSEDLLCEGGVALRRNPSHKADQRYDARLGHADNDFFTDNEIEESSL